MDTLERKDVKFYDRAWLFTSHKETSYIFPLFGQISCGAFKLIDSDIEGYLEIPKAMLGKGDYFALRANGNSMIEAGIDDGDIVIVKKNSSPNNGQIAVVLMESDVVLKRFYKIEEEKKYLLHPENSMYSDIEIDRCEVLGIAVKVIKNIV